MSNAECLLKGSNPLSRALLGHMYIYTCMFTLHMGESEHRRNISSMFPQQFCRWVEFHLIFQSFTVVHYLWRLIRKALWLSLSGQWTSGNQWFQPTFDGGLVILEGELLQSSSSELVSSSRLVGIVERRGSLWRRTFSWAFVRLFLRKHVVCFLLRHLHSLKYKLIGTFSFVPPVFSVVLYVMLTLAKLMVNQPPIPSYFAAIVWFAISIHIDNKNSLFLSKGIFPASYIHLKDAIVEGKGWVLVF